MPKPAPRPPVPPAAPLHFTPPTPRELRAQAVQRLQVGLFGVALMLLVVGLANIVMNRVRQADAASASTSGAHPQVAAPVRNDPLADIGVAPAPDSSARPRSSPPAH